MFVLACLTTCCAFAEPTAAETVSRVAVTAPRTSVLTDRGSDGVVWAKGKDWKMRFGRDGGSFVPVFGERAPRNYVLDLTLTDVTIGLDPLPYTSGIEATLERNRITYDRGLLDETYDLGVDGVEQSFVLDSFPGAGDLRIRMATGADLPYRGRDSGLVFGREGLGSVIYGDVTVVDAKGARWNLESNFVTGAIELSVPASVLALAAYPLTIDPKIKTVFVDNDGGDDQDPDVDFELDRWLVVYENTVSASDHDIVSRRYDQDGNFLEEVAVDISNDDTIDPAVAGAGNEFLIVWLKDGGIVVDNLIRGRLRAAGSTSQQAAFDISTGTANEANPDVGGTPNNVTNKFFVVWDEDPALQPRRAVGRRVDANGGIGSLIVLHTDNSPIDRPRISRSAGAAGFWMVSYMLHHAQNDDILVSSIHDADLAFYTINAAGFLPGSPPTHPDLDGDGKDFLLVWQAADSAHPGFNDIQASKLEVAPDGSINESFAFIPLSKDLDGTNETIDQTEPVVASEGCRFTVGYLAGNLGVRTAHFDTFLVDPVPPNLIFPLDRTTVVSTDPDLEPAVATTEFAIDGLVFGAYTRDLVSITNDNVEGALITTLNGGGITTVQTGCGSPEPGLFVSGATIGGAMNISLISFSGPTGLLMLGLPIVPVPLCAGQFASCALGVSPIATTLFPVSLDVSIPCSSALVGATIAFQAFDLLPANAIGTLCGPPKYTQKFRTTDTKVVTFQ